MKYVLSILGVIAAVVLLCVSAAMNWRFGFTLGKTEFDGHIYGAASVAADGMKALAPFFIIWAFRQKNYIQSLSGVLILVVCSFYSLTSSLGFSALNRADVIGERTAHANQYKDLRTELKRAEEKMGWIPQHRSVGEVEADLTALMSKPIYSRKHGLLGTVQELTEGCSKTHWRARSTCAKALNLRKELAVAQQAQKLDVRINDLKKKIAGVSQEGGAAVIAGADPQSAFLSKILGVNINDIQTLLTLMVSVLVEVGSGLGLYVAVSNIKPNQREYSESRDITEPVRVSRRIEGKPVRKLSLPKSDLERYYADQVEKAEGGSVVASVLYENYCDWCTKNARDPMALPVFGRQFTEFGIQKAKIGGKIRYIGISVKEVELPEEPEADNNTPESNGENNESSSAEVVKLAAAL